MNSEQRLFTEAKTSMTSWEQIYEQADSFLDSVDLYIVSPSPRREIRKLNNLLQISNFSALRAARMQKQLEIKPDVVTDKEKISQSDVTQTKTKEIQKESGLGSLLRLEKSSLLARRTKNVLTTLS